MSQLSIDASRNELYFAAQTLGVLCKSHTSDIFCIPVFHSVFQHELTGGGQYSHPSGLRDLTHVAAREVAIATVYNKMAIAVDDISKDTLLETPQTQLRKCMCAHFNQRGFEFTPC